MKSIPWSAPATPYGRPFGAASDQRERAIAVCEDLKSAVAFVATGSSGSLDNIVIKLDDGTAVFSPSDIRAMIADPSRPALES